MVRRFGHFVSAHNFEEAKISRMARSLSNSKLCVHHLLLPWFILCWIPGIYSAGVVTLEAIEIFNTHEWLSTRPTVYFVCQGEKKIILPDVKKKTFLYTFNGEESWQPLTELAEKKCKRCGFYEKDTFILKKDDIFDEWEFCPSDFMPSDGRYVRFKEKEFNATFSCPQCKGSTHPSEGSKEKKPIVALVVIISVVLSIVCIFAAVAAYKYWKKRKRQQEQARFLKLFEDGDEIEDEFGIDHI